MPILNYRPSNFKQHVRQAQDPLAVWTTASAGLPPGLLVKNSPAGAPIAGVGDYLRMKAWNGASVVDNYLLVTARDTSNPLFTAYTYTLSNSGTPSAFKAGTAVVRYKPGPAGYVYLTSDDTNGPYISVKSWASLPWNQIEQVRLGNLNSWGEGATPYSGDTYGFAAGRYNVPNYTSIAIESSNGIRIWNNATLIGQWDTTGTITVGQVASSQSNILITSGAVKLRNNTTEAIRIQANGDVFVGSDLSLPGSTYFSIFSANRTYNTEAFLAGDMLIGDNSSGKANIKWDKAAGQLKFRGGTTVQVYIDTTGALKAGGGNVTLDSSGINLANQNGSSLTGSIYWGAADVVQAYNDTFENQIYIAAGIDASLNAASVTLYARDNHNNNTWFKLYANHATTRYWADLWGGVGGVFQGLAIGPNIAVPATMLDVQGSGTFSQGVNVGTGTLSPTGVIRIDGFSGAPYTSGGVIQGYDGATYHGLGLDASEIDFFVSASKVASFGTSGGLNIGSAAGATTGAMRVGTASPAGQTTAAGNIESLFTDGIVRTHNTTANYVEVHIRPVATKNGFLSFSENGVADRWSVGILGGDATLYFMLGYPGGGGATQMKLDNSGNLTTVGGLNVGTATGATAGQIKASGGLILGAPATSAGAGQASTEKGYLAPLSAGSAVFGIDANNTGTTVANNATITPFGNSNNFGGLLLVEELGNGNTGLYLISGTNVALVSNNGGNFSNTSGTASHVNVYLASGVVTIENKMASREIRVLAFRIRNSSS